MKKKTLWITSAAVGTALGLGLDKASSAALAEAGGGTVTEVERSDDADHAYEVEITLENGQDDGAPAA